MIKVGNYVELSSGRCGIILNIKTISETTRCEIRILRGVPEHPKVGQTINIRSNYISRSYTLLDQYLLNGTICNIDS